jgi:hypothetical protein
MTHPLVKDIKEAMPNLKWEQIGHKEGVCLYAVWDGDRKILGTMTEIRDELWKK